MTTLEVPTLTHVRSYRSTKVPMLVKCVEGKDVEGNILLNDYIFRHQLGEGSYGDVFVIQKEENGIFKKSAVKIMKRKKPVQKRFGKKRSENGSNNLMDEEIKNEIQAMKSIQHKNTVGIKEVICNDQKEFLYIVMEYCENGELIEWIEEDAIFKFRKDRERLTEHQLRKLCRDCLKGLQSIFMNQLVHRDIKPQNILFDEFYNAKICDFGVVAQINEDTLKDVKGTIMFHSPEILRKDFPIKGRAADIWALGASFYCFAYLKHPFVDGPCQCVIDEASENIINSDLSFPENNCYSWQFRQFVAGMLHKDPEERSCLTDLLNHPWLNEGFEMNAHDEVMREMKHQFEHQIEKKPQLSLFQFVMIKHYVRDFKKRYAEKIKEQNKNLYGLDGELPPCNILRYTNHPSMVELQTKSMFKFQIVNPTLTMKLFLPTAEFELKIYIPSSEWGIDFVLGYRGETWSSCMVSLERINDLFQRGKKRWSREEFVLVMKKAVRLMKVSDRRLVFEQE